MKNFFKKEENINRIILFVFLFTVFSALFFGFYRFYIKKDFNYIIEAPCNSESEDCFYRDCESDPEICPPNMLSFYKKFTISAKDFEKCSDNSCLKECESNIIVCSPITCGDFCE